MKRLAVIILAIGVVVVTALGAIGGEKLGWRAQVVAMKARGDLDFISWNETFRWMLPGSPVYLDNLLKGGNPHVALTNTRYVSAADVAQGEVLFRQNCASCHGGVGEGASAPALNMPARFRSDWSLYRTIQRGIPGTAMPPNDLPDLSVWRLITYLATLAPDSSDVVGSIGIDIAPVSFARIRARADEMDNWLSYSGGYNGWRYSELNDINVGNARNLALKWIYQSDTTYNKFQANPIVADGVMFVSEPQGRVVALDAASGKLLWAFARPVPDGLVLCCGIMNRGVAVLEQTVFVTTIDAHLLALDMQTGQLKWEIEVADHRVGYSISSAPLAIDGRVVTGVAGGETGIRGFLAAYDAQTGELAWQFDTVPAPGEQGSDTWSNDLWQIGGAATWMIGSYDPDLDLIYWGTSHTVHEPQLAASHDDKLYGSSILAVRGATGERVWHFQATPDDIHGFDAGQVPVLIDIEVNGEVRQLLLNANRNGYLYMLDRSNGQFVSGIPFAELNWSLGLDGDGRPIVNPDARPDQGGTLVWPNSVGATNWWPPTFNPRSGQLCVPVVDGPSVYYSQDATYTPGRPYVLVVGRQSFNQAANRYIRCLDSQTGALEWEKTLAPASERSGPIAMAGLLTTAGNLLFGSDGDDFFALDAAAGQELWRIGTGARILPAPVTYRAQGEQYIAVTSGRALLVFGLHRPQ